MEVAGLVTALPWLVDECLSPSGVHGNKKGSGLALGTGLA